MRANYRLQRLFVPDDLGPGATVVPEPRQTHYLLNVMRMREGSELLVFNGRDGEWAADLVVPGKKKAELHVGSLVRPQPAASDLVFCFAPLKAGRLDYLVQKAVEMGAGVIRPVTTQHTQTPKVGLDRLRANAIEAAEQCGVLAVPAVEETVSLDRLLADWDPSRRLIFCDEAAEGDNPLAILTGIGKGPLGLIVGPEGGFSDEERHRLHALPFVTAIWLGPRILRADTAAVAALAVVQASIGDW
ncbi:MAG: 16S rRNA (uracil(1498)-N(3))-methyltransferase [Rhizobiaceae bacterium]|nr:16S rRNA (uracil(1498)-N(3))-methyltransferase [Rhizobiaceae bacterium]MCV0406110.1 16S rRNA (uracil(1498)-N(3))-methyltransferase [Rhizobiaceae bacterium]